MVHGGQVRKKYASDLTDEQWAIMEPLIPPAKRSPRGGRPRKVHMREVLHTLFYLNRSGCQWDMLPHDLLPKSTVYDYFVQWRDDGTWAKLVRSISSSLEKVEASVDGHEKASKGLASLQAMNPAMERKYTALAPDYTHDTV